MSGSKGRPPFKVTRTVLHVLLALGGGEAHGYAIMVDVGESTRGRVKLGPGSLYFTLSRLADAGLIEEVYTPAGSEDERRRTYRLAPPGRALLVAELEMMSDILESARAKRLLAGESAA
jgi:DNA-binding PadR family transcriptional regulator